MAPKRKAPTAKAKSAAKRRDTVRQEPPEPTRTKETVQQNYDEQEESHQNTSITPGLSQSSAPRASHGRTEMTEDMMAELQRYREQYGDQMRSVTRSTSGEVSSRKPREDLNLTYWDAMERMRTMGMDYFGGGTDPVTADNWRRRLEKNLETIRCPEEHRRDLAAHYLKDEASVWWEAVLSSFPNPERMTWAGFKKEFDRKYFPREAVDAMAIDFMELKQGNRTVREYEAEFDRLRRFAGNGLTDEELVNRFIHGMNLDLQDKCIIGNYDCVSSVVAKAVKVERLMQTKAPNVRNTPVPGGKGVFRLRSPVYSKLLLIVLNTSE